MWLVVTFGLLLTLGGLVGLMMTGGPARRGALVAVITAFAIVPFVFHEQPILYRALIALATLTLWFRVIELARERRPVPALRRVMHATMVVEMRRTRRVPRVLHVPSLLRVMAFGGLTLAVVLVISRLPASGDWTVRGSRWLAGVVVSYASFEGLAASTVLVWRGVGFDVPRLSDDPIKSRTVAEFWSQRWNRAVGGWLRDQVFRPFVRRKQATVGIIAAFAVSTLIHVYLAWAALDANAALMWAIFFSLQIPIVFAERVLRVSSWPVPLARVWTIGIICAASPFFVDPMLRIFEAMTS